MAGELFRRALEEAQRRRQQKEPTLELTQAELVGVDGDVEVAGRPGFSWVREHGQDTISQVFNPNVQQRDGLAVLLGPAPKAPFRRIVRDVNWEIIAVHPDYDGDPFLPTHHRSHEMPDHRPGADAVNVYVRAWVPGRVYAGGGLTVSVAPCRYNHSGASVLFDGAEGYDLAASEPAVGLARLVLVYLDKNTNAIGHVDGDTAPDSYAVRPGDPVYPDAPHIPLALVRLAGNQTTITEADVDDLRTFWEDAGAASAMEQLAWLEHDLDFELSRLIVEMLPEIVNRIVSRVADELAFDLNRHIVEG